MTSCNLYIMIIYRIVIKEESNNHDRQYTNLLYRTTLHSTHTTLHSTHTTNLSLYSTTDSHNLVRVLISLGDTVLASGMKQYKLINMCLLNTTFRYLAKLTTRENV